MKTRRDQITKIGRLLKRSDFLRVQGAGKKWVTPTCIVQMVQTVTPHPNPTMLGSTSPSRGEVPPLLTSVLAGDDALSAPASPYLCRYGLTVTKKIWKHSVDRNRVRRRVRAVLLGILAGRMNTGQIPPQTDFVVLPRVSALTAPIEAIEKDLSWAIKRLTTVDQK